MHLAWKILLILTPPISANPIPLSPLTNPPTTHVTILPPSAKNPSPTIPTPRSKPTPSSTHHQPHPPPTALPPKPSPPPLLIPLPIMDAEPQQPSSLDPYGLPLITFPTHPAALPIFDIPSQKAESVGSITVPSITLPSLATEPYSRVKISGLTTGDMASLSVPSAGILSESPSVLRPSLGGSKPTIRLPSSTPIPFPTLPTTTPLPHHPPFLNTSTPTNLTIPSLHPPIPSPPFHPPFHNNTATNLTSPLPTTNLPATPQSPNITALIANATKAIQVLEILIDIASSGAKTGGGMEEDKEALMRTLLEGFFPLLRGFVEGG